MKLDVLVFASHPDDAELGCSGTIAALIAAGKKVGVIDFTQGEMGTRGTPALRLQEADAASKVLGLSVRENLGFKDVFFKIDLEHQLALIKKIRQYQPDIVIANAVTDRHVDHGKGGLLATEACFMAGLRKIETTHDGKDQSAWRPKHVYHYIQNNYIKPDFIVDITAHWNTKVAAIKAFKSQFFDPESTEPASFISSPEFMKFIEARAREFGHQINVEFGEGFTVERPVGVRDITQLV